MDCTHARGVLPTRTSRMGTAKVEADRNNSKRIVKNQDERNVGTKWKSPKQGPTCAEHFTVELFKVRESSYHRSD